MAKSTPKYSFETIDQVLSDIKQNKGLEAPTKVPGLGSSKSVLPSSNINSVLSYGGGNPKKAVRIAEYNVPLESVYERLNDGSYTSKYENYLGAEGNENRLALQQSGWEQTGKGLLKNVSKVGTYAFDSVVGTAYGLTKALTSGQLRNLYDNELTNHLDDMNKKLDYALPNYYSDEQKSMSWLRQMGTVNFWANDVAGGFAFVGGALLPQIAIGVATGGASLPSLGVTAGKLGAKLAFKAGKEVAEEAAKATIKKGIKSNLDDGLKAIGSASQKLGQATGYTKGKNVIKSYQQAVLGDKLGTFTNTAGFLARTSSFEAGMEARQAMKESVDNYYQQFQEQNGRMPTFEESQAFMGDAVKASNKVFGANMSILTLSNAVMFGKKILPESASNWINKTIGGKVNNIIGLGTKSSVIDGKLTYTMLGANRAQKIAGKAYKTFSKPLVEGLYEEGLQGVASKTMKNYLDAKYDKNNLDGYSFWSSLNDGFAEQYGSNEGWKEMAIGMIVGFAGGGMTPGAIKNGYAFSGFGKNSYTSRRAEIESNIKRANDGIELLSNLNRTSATVAKEAAMNSGDTSNFTGAEDTLSHYNFIRSQESINSYSQMKNDFNVIADNLQFEDESIEALNRAGLDADSYRTKLKDDFSKSLANYQFAKKAVESLGLNKTLKDIPGNIAEISDALMFGIMAGKDSFENSKNIASQIDSIIGTEGTFNHLNFYNNLDQDKKDQFLELRDKKENLKQLQDAAARVSQKIGKINSTGQMTPELVENRRKKLSEQAVSIQDSIANTNQRIQELEDILSTDFRNTKYNLSSEVLDNIGTTEDIIGAVENIDKIDNLIQSFDKAGKKQEADTLRYLVNQFKVASDSHREMINTHRKMMDTNYFSSKEGKGFLKSILGDKFTMSDDLKQLIQENDAIIDNSLKLNGIRDYDKVQDILESSIVDNDQLSDREKFRLESLIRISLSKGAYEKAVDNLQSMSKDMQTRMTDTDRSLSTTVADVRRVNLTKDDLNNVKLIDEAINEITKELDYIINYSSKNIEKIKSLEEELAKLKEEKEALKENLEKQKENIAPEQSQQTADIERRRKEDLQNGELFLMNDGTYGGSRNVSLNFYSDVQIKEGNPEGDVRTWDYKNYGGTGIFVNKKLGIAYIVPNNTFSKTPQVFKVFMDRNTFRFDLNNPRLINRPNIDMSAKAYNVSADDYYNEVLNAVTKYDAELASLSKTTTTTEDAEKRRLEELNTQLLSLENKLKAIAGNTPMDKLDRGDIQNTINSIKAELNSTTPVKIPDSLKDLVVPTIIHGKEQTIFTTNSLDRTVVFVKIDGKIYGFYQSTNGTDDKIKNHWYPFYGKASGWVVKDGGGKNWRYNNQASPELQAKLEESANKLNAEYGNEQFKSAPYIHDASETEANNLIGSHITNANQNLFNSNIEEYNRIKKKTADEGFKRSNSELAALDENVQQNEVFTDTEQENLLNKKIEDLQKQIDELKRPLKIIESPEYIRYYELASKSEKDSLTEKEKEELNELRADIDQWTLITGVVVDGFRLSDLLLQKSVLENSIIEKVQDIEIPTSEDTLDEIDFADSATKANYKYGLVYDKVFASKEGDLITLHNMNAEALVDILGKDFIDQNGIVIEEDPTGKDNLVLTQDSIDKINQNSNLRIRNTERNMLTKFSVVLEKVVGLDGKAIYRPLSSNFSEEINGGEGHDIQAIFDANKDDEVEITTDLDNVYNIRIINEYKEELNNFNAKPQKSEQDRIELEKAFNKLISKLNMQAKVNGKVVSTMKGLNKTIKDKNSDNVYVQFRANIFSDPEQVKAILTGSGEYSVKVTNNEGEFIKPKVTVSEVLMGHPNYNYTETEDGLLATEFRGLSDTEAKAIVDVGYVLGTKTFTRDNQTVNTIFLKKLMNKKSTNKIPFIVLNVGGKRVGYPVKVNSFGQAEISEFESVYSNATTDPVTKANALNRILAKNGIDIKQPGNAFIGFFDNNINDKFFQEKLAQLKNVNYFYNVEDWIDLNVDLQDIVKTQLAVDINVLNPFHSPKLSFNFSELNLKDFVPPKKGKKKTKAASKSKNVEVNLADLFNKKNCQ